VQVFFNRFCVATGDPIVGSVLGYHLSVIPVTCLCLSQARTWLSNVIWGPS